MFKISLLQAGAFISWLLSSEATVKYLFGNHLLRDFISFGEQVNNSPASLGVVNNYCLHSNTTL